MQAVDAPAKQALQLLRQMIRIRRFEERAAQAYAEQKIHGFLHLYIGEEAVATGIIPLLDSSDTIITTYREHAHALLRGISANAIMAEMYGKAEGCSRGRGGSMHVFDAATRFYGGNGIVAGGIPLALGFALADKLRNHKTVTCCFFGEGAAAEGAFHESMNMAALWKLPILYACENNLYAMGTRLDLSESVTNIRAKASAYGITAASVNGMDVEAVRDAAAIAVAYVRAGNGPYFLECRTYRYHGHSTSDPQLYRSKAEVAAWKKHDPIENCIARLRERNELRDEDLAAMERDAEREAQAAAAFAEAGTLEPPANLTRYTYKESAT